MPWRHVEPAPLRDRQGTHSEEWVNEWGTTGDSWIDYALATRAMLHPERAAERLRLGITAPESAGMRFALQTFERENAMPQVLHQSRRLRVAGGAP